MTGHLTVATRCDACFRVKHSRASKKGLHYPQIWIRGLLLHSFDMTMHTVKLHCTLPKVPYITPHHISTV